jgi:hypothetical protein
MAFSFSSCDTIFSVLLENFGLFILRFKKIKEQKNLKVFSQGAANSNL